MTAREGYRVEVRSFSAHRFALGRSPQRKMPETEARGATPLARGGTTVKLEGRDPGRIVILPFESLDAAKAFYDSPEYQKARAARAGAATMNMIIVEGV